MQKIIPKRSVGGATKNVTESVSWTTKRTASASSQQLPRHPTHYLQQLPLEAITGTTVTHSGSA